jgi:hypothetical protein
VSRHARREPSQRLGSRILGSAGAGELPDRLYGAARRAQRSFVVATGRRPNPRWIAAAAGGVLLLALPLLFGVTGSDPEPTKVADQDSTLGLPWWEAGGEPGSPSPTPDDSPSDTYIVVGPVVEPPSPSVTGAPPSGARATRRPPTSPAPALAPARPIGPVVTALVGEECETHNDSRGYKRVGAHDDGERSFDLRSDGGWDGDGCDGSYFAVPMSGDADRSDPDIYNVWWIKTGELRQGICNIHIYVPEAHEPQDVTGRPAFYNVVAGKDNYTRVSGFAIDQVASQGRWVDAGNYVLRNGEIAVQMINRGDDRDGHVAAAQAAFACRPVR